MDIYYFETYPLDHDLLGSLRRYNYHPGLRQVRLRDHGRERALVLRAIAGEVSPGGGKCGGAARRELGGAGDEPDATERRGGLGPEVEIFHRRVLAGLGGSDAARNGEHLRRRGLDFHARGLR